MSQQQGEYSVGVVVLLPAYKSLILQSALTDHSVLNNGLADS